KLQTTFSRFYYKQQVLEEMILVSENIHDKIWASLRTIEEFERDRKSPQQHAIIHSEKSKLKALEDFVRMPCEQYLKAYEQMKPFAALAHQSKTEMGEPKLRWVICIR